MTYALNSPVNRQRMCLTYSSACLGFLLLLVIGPTAHAQRVILNETFENDSPDSFPNSADFFAKSSIVSFNADFDNNKAVNGGDFLIWQRGFNTGTTKADGDANASGTVDGADLGVWESEFGSGDPANIVVTGGQFADPFNPGSNQSMVLHNPDGTSQMAVTWTDEFMDDPSTFVNGSIDFDLWMESPDPDAFWTYLGVRIGHGDSTRSGLGGAPGEMTTWNTFRMQNGAEALLEQMSDPGHGITTGVETTFADNGDDVMGPDRSFHVRYEFEEMSTSGGTFDGFPVYRVIVTDTTIEWSQDSEVEHSWVFSAGTGGFAPGVNILTLITDASGHGVDPDPGTGNVYIDNLVIINADLPPLLASSTAVPEPSALTLAFLGCAIMLRRGLPVSRSDQITAGNG